MLVSAVGRLFRGRPVAIFLSGLIAGIFTSVAMTGGGYAAYRFPQTQPPSHISQLRAQGVSHNPEILKRVLATRDVLPHVTQISMATIKPGQVATENFHHDMVEMFVFLSGHGILRLDDTNHTVKKVDIPSSKLYLESCDLCANLLI